MEEDEIQMSREELQKWIRRKVKKSTLMISDVLEKCNLLQSLLERREKQAAQLLRLCQALSACEATVKKQYSLLGWKYRETDSDDDDDDDDLTGCGNTALSPPTANGPAPLLPKLQYRENLHRHNSKKINLKREPVVVLTRLSSCKIRSLRRPAPPNSNSEDESLNNAASDVQWEPQDDSPDSDYSFKTNDTGPIKRRKIDKHNEKPAKSHAKKPQASTSTDAKSNIMQTSTQPGNANPAAKSNVTKASTPRAVTNSKAKSHITQTSSLQISGSTADKRDIRKTSTSPANTNEATKTPPSVSHEELKVNMTVLARQRAMNWQRGKITEILTKGGRLKYKIDIEDKGKSLVSGHHIAFDHIPKVEQLHVGARVLIKCQTDQCQFCAGILGELPSRKNRMRFLVFVDDHTAAYVGLPLLRLVCRPLKDPLDDVPDGLHKDFLRGYLKAWPFPPQNQYKVGQTIDAELKGVLQRCKVKTVDCSLIEVVSMDKRNEWIYRGSTCLEHVLSLKGSVESKKDDRQNNKSPRVDESLKSAH